MQTVSSAGTTDIFSGCITLSKTESLCNTANTVYTSYKIFGGFSGLATGLAQLAQLNEGSGNQL